jgi:hypothetical protein
MSAFPHHGDAIKTCRCDSDGKGEVGGQRITFLGTFPTAPSRTWRVPFDASRSPVGSLANSHLFFNKLKIISFAIPEPTSRESRCMPPQPGRSPSDVSGRPSWAVSAAIRMRKALYSVDASPHQGPGSAALCSSHRWYRPSLPPVPGGRNEVQTTRVPSVIRVVAAASDRIIQI